MAAAAGDGGEAPTVVSARPIQSLWAGERGLPWPACQGMAPRKPQLVCRPCNATLPCNHAAGYGSVYEAETDDEEQLIIKEIGAAVMSF